MNSTDLLHALWAFARVRRPADRFIEIALERLPKEMQNYNATQLASLSWALANVATFFLKRLKYLFR